VLTTVVVNVALVTYLVFAVLEYISRSESIDCLKRECHKLNFAVINLSGGDSCKNDCDLTFCSPFGMLLFVAGAAYIGCFYFLIVKPHFGKQIGRNVLKPVGRMFRQALKTL
jgi:hypothetical protein